MLYSTRHTLHPLGEFILISDGTSLLHLACVGQKHFPSHRIGQAVHQTLPYALPLFDQVVMELQEYVTGRRTVFSIPVRYTGTPFQNRVWTALETIPYGTTITYQGLAQAISYPSASRAIASAVARNPLMILIPCHRVIGSDGTLKGFAGGTPLKQQLLSLEAQHLEK